jgi:hypothetical protein
MDAGRSPGARPSGNSGPGGSVGRVSHSGQGDSTDAPRRRRRRRPVKSRD